MSATTQYTTFSDLYTGLQNLLGQQTGISATQQQAKRAIDSAHHDLYVDRGEQFPWAERRAFLKTAAQYTTGTLDATQGSGTVTGNSTTWNTDSGHGSNNVVVGAKLTISGSFEVYEWTAVSSDTAGTISPEYIGDTDTELSYTSFQDEYALASDFLKPIDFRSFDAGHRIALLGRQDFRRAAPRNRTPVDYPVCANIIDLPFSGDTTPVRKVRFAPPPATVQVIPYSYVTSNIVIDSTGSGQASFSADTDEPIMPLRFRHAIVLKAWETTLRYSKDDLQKAAQVRADLEELLGRMVSDQDLGYQRASMKMRAGYRRRSRRPWGGSLRSNDRFDTNGAFDRLEDR